MATINSTDSAADALAKLNQQVADLRAQKQKQSTLQVQSFRKDTYDVAVDTKLTARDIGTLKVAKTRLNLFSALSTGDSVDVFRFKVDRTSKTRIGVLAADPEAQDAVRIQIFSKATGRIVADNDPKAGDLSDNFDALQSGELELKRGDYILRISRQDNVDPRLKKNFNYGIQLSQGTYTEDYDSVEKAKKKNAADPYGFGGVGVGTNNLIDGLTSSYSFISSLPKIGSSGTEKLSGVLLDSIL